MSREPNWARNRRLDREAEESAKFYEERVGPLLAMDAPADDGPDPDIPLEDPGEEEEVEIPLDDPDIPLEESQAPATITALVPAVMDILPADFPLPTLIKFTPNPAFKIAVLTAANAALEVKVEGEAGLQLADAKREDLRTAIKAAEAHFADPASIADKLHKGVTGCRGEWTKPGTEALATIDTRILAEKRRLDAIAAEAKRRAQEEADRQAREQARLAAELAAKQHAPAAVVEDLKKQAETATAPPVGASSWGAPAMKTSTTVEKWKTRPRGTPADAEPNPPIAKMTTAQLQQVKVLLQAILEEKAPITAIEVNWSVLNARAVSDKSTFSIPGIEAFDAGSVRAKGSRGRA